MVKMFSSGDNNELYSEENVENKEHFTEYEIPETFTLHADQVLGCDGCIIEMLVRAGIAIRT